MNNSNRVSLGWNTDRRGFLKSAMVGLAIAAKPRFLWGQAKKSTGEEWAMLVDITRCIGCRACSRACLKANNLPETNNDNDLPTQSIESLSFQRYSALNAQTTDTATGSSTRFVKQQCMHCLEPSCVSVCPVGALDKTNSGPVVYKADRCIGCRYCMIACPFDIPKFEWNSGLKPVIGKCQFCARERLFKGELPGCIESCPTGALKFGKRKSLLFEAHGRIKAHPEKYVNHIYGEKEVGGTAWLYLSDVPFDKLGFKQNLPAYPLPSLTAEVVSRIPAVVAALSVVLGMLGLSLSRSPKKEEPS